MELVRWNPVRDVFGLRNRMNRMFDWPLYHLGTDSEDWSALNWRPVVDVLDNDESYTIKAELPGVDKKDISIDVEDRVLTLKGERATENEANEDKYRRRERAYGKFERTFILPTDVNLETIKADYNDGVLVIAIPKAEEKKPKRITVH